MADAETKRNYPYVSNNVWAELKSRFEKSLPAKVTTTYLQTVLGFESEKAAKNLIPQLRLIGLIDGEGVPTQLAQRFRMDSDYAEAAREIVQSVYPDELRNIYPGPDEDVNAVANWFMRDTSGGRSSAVIQARFYLTLVSGKLPASERAAKTTKPPKEAANPASPTPARATIRKPASRDRNSDNKVPEMRAPDSSHSGPALHIDVQVHIDASATSDQIDAVFASMAKHLYGRS